MKKQSVLNLNSALLAAFALTFSLSGHSMTEKMEQEMLERLAPVGQVCLEGDDSCGGAVTVAASGSMSAEDIYNKNCAGCHMTGAAGAPKVGDKAAWSARAEKGLEQLVMNAVKGINAMPAMGLCGSCSEDDIANTVEYMLENSK